MINFMLFTSTTTGNSAVSSFPNKVVVTDKQSFIDAIKFDHVMAEYKNNHRKGDNFIQSDVIPMDCDNEHSDDAKDWVTPLEVALAFPDVRFAVSYSRNHMKTKGSKTARPRFHVYFPVDVIMDKKVYVSLKQSIQKEFSYFDGNALDAARLLYGTNNTKVEIYNGNQTIQEFLNNDLFAEWDDGQHQITEGSRNNAMSHVAGKLIKRYGNSDSSKAEFLNLAAKKCVPSLSDEELSIIWNSAVSFGKKVAIQDGYIPPEQFNADLALMPSDYSDVGQAMVLAREYGDVLRFSPKLGYLVFNGRYWTISEESAIGLAQALTDRQLLEIEIEISKVTEEMKKNGTLEILATVGAKKAITIFNSVQKCFYQRYESVLQYQKYAIKRRDSRYIKSALAMIEPHIPIEIEQLDAGEFLLNTPSATYDLRTGNAKAHDSSDFITQQTALVPSDKGAVMWNDALDLIFCGDEELKTYVQKIVGLAAIGKVKQEALIIAYGDGQNGKSTFWNSIFRVLGSYAGSLSSEIITANNRANAKNEKAELRGKRFIIAGELEENQRLSTSMVKQLTSTDPIKGEKKYRDEFVFIPTHTLVLYTNHLPKVGANDKGTWRRLLVVPLNAAIKASTDKKNYGDELYRKAGGAILQWIIDGAKQVIAEEFKPIEPQAVIDATSKYKQENDWLNEFFEECCELDESYMEKSGEVYDTYRSHCQRIGDWPRSQAHFYSALERAGITKIRKNKGRYFKGIRLQLEDSMF
jgi:phage/plasmid primase, P4 family, C-terminal domain